MKQKREEWVDYIKVFACVLVALGHFFQSMVTSAILPDNSLYQWFNTTIYYFHVPLFFICSGYLYQKYSCVDSFRTWKSNVFKKVMALGIPYFEFSIINWLLKTIFSGDVNHKVNGLADALFVHPIPPYWYLYILIPIFIITPTVKTSKGIGTLLTISTAGMLSEIIWSGGGVQRTTGLCCIKIPY